MGKQTGEARACRFPPFVSVPTYAYFWPVSALNLKPIVVLHRGDAYYLPYCLQQARFSNPDTPIYFLGDESNQHLAEGITHRLISQYNPQASQFAGQYVHLSTRSEPYELFCIQRWFVLLAFMTQHELTACVHLDSDVLLYDDLSRSGDWLGGDILQYVHWIPHVLYINSRAALEAFCQFITHQYQDPARLQVLRDRYQRYLDGHDPGLVGISDMTLLELYQKEHDERTANLLKQREFTDQVHEDNISTVSLFAPDPFGFGKQLVWQKKQPFGSFNGRRIRFQSLHCQGYAKARMPWLSTFPKRGRWIAYSRDLLRYSLPYYLRGYYRYARYGRS